MAKFNSESIWSELKQKGYCVIQNVVPPNQCDELRNELKSWALGRADDIFNNPIALINIPRVAHLEQAWKVRLFAKDAFAAVWGTEKLVTSFDKISVAPPPEQGTCDFDTGFTWLHIDRSGYRRGLHAFQGGVYLEETTETDHCLRIMEGSFKYTDEFFDTHPAATEKAHPVDHYKLSAEEIEWYKAKGCVVKTIAAPKGSLILWDTRTVHDNVKPQKGRPHSDRWRCIVFVCMLPAIWAMKKDLEVLRHGYEKMLVTCHMPCMKVRIHGNLNEEMADNLKAVQELPDIAKSPEVKQLVGIEKYDFNDGKPNGPAEIPKWTSDDMKIY